MKVFLMLVILATSGCASHTFSDNSPAFRTYVEKDGSSMTFNKNGDLVHQVVKPLSSMSAPSKRK